MSIYFCNAFFPLPALDILLVSPEYYYFFFRPVGCYCCKRSVNPSEQGGGGAGGGVRALALFQDDVIF